MAKKRAKRFDEGGDVGTYDYASLGKREPKMDKEALDRFNKAMDDRRDRESNQGDVNAEFARKPKDLYTGDKTASFKAEASDKAEASEDEVEPVKPTTRQAGRIVSKKELADSGLTLREFLNRERKLKPRGAATPKKAAETKVPEATPAQLAERKKQERAQALEESHPEELIIGGPLLKAGRAGLAALRSAKEVGKRIEPYIASTGRDLATRGGREVGKRMDDLRTIYDDGVPKLANRAKQLGTEALKLTRFKHGGSVKASKMGSVKTAKPKMTSASSRGDGIAQRGKTKGRIC
jgi:hypothetical protein